MSKVIFGVVVGLLLCSLSTLEVPEFLNLSDDTSNDYSFVSVQEQPSLMVERQAGSRVESGVVSAKVRHDLPIVAVSVGFFVSADDDPFHSLCLLRT